MLNIVLLIHLFTSGHQTSMFTTGFFALIKDVFLIRPTPLWITRHALLIHHASDWFSCFCSSEVNSKWKFLLMDVTIFYYSECHVFLPCVFLSLSPSFFIPHFTSSSSLSDQSDAGEWDQVCGSRACGTEVRQHPSLHCGTWEFALIHLIYYILPWVSSAENSRPLIKAHLFWQATAEPAEPWTR